jgi:hypothetical protein
MMPTSLGLLVHRNLSSPNEQHQLAEPWLEFRHLEPEKWTGQALYDEKRVIEEAVSCVEN